MATFGTLDWFMAQGEVVVHYGSFPVTDLLPADERYSSDTRKELAGEICRGLNYVSDDAHARHRLGRVYFGHMPLRDFQRGIIHAGLRWPAFKAAFDWRLVCEAMDPEQAVEIKVKKGR